MQDEYGELIDHSNRFFTQLSQNNSKAWFEPKKQIYRDTIKLPAERLAAELAQKLRDKTGKDHDSKLFRIHRDLRFSKDKTPYNAHLHLIWRQGTDTAPAWFLGSAPDYLVLGVGVMQLSGQTLDRYRKFIDEFGTALVKAIQSAAESADASLSDWGAPALKRVPKPYDENHPHADLLRRKNLVVSAPISDQWRQDGFVETVQNRMDALLPIWKILDNNFG